MAKIYKSIDELIGRTPLMELSNLEQKLELQATLLAKVEALNPGGSAKDRVAKRMVEDAEKAGILKAGATIIEPTSGNTGIGLAVMAAARGYRAIIVMPDSMSMERRLLMTAFGAELVLPGMVVSRGISYYTQLLLSAVMTVAASFIIRKKD